MFFEGFNWQANLTSLSKPNLLIIDASWEFGSLTLSRPEIIFTLQVVHLPLPPQTETCGIPAILLASRTETPLGILISLPSGYWTIILPKRLTLTKFKILYI